MGEPRSLAGSWDSGSEREWICNWSRILTTSSGAMTNLSVACQTFSFFDIGGSDSDLATNPAVAPAVITWILEP